MQEDSDEQYELKELELQLKVQIASDSSVYIK